MWHTEFCFYTIELKKSNKFIIALRSLIFKVVGQDNLFCQFRLCIIHWSQRFHNKIETARQFYAANIHWGAPHPVWAMSLEHAQVPYIQALFQRFEAHDDATLHNRSMTRGFGVAIERLHAGSFSFGDYVKIDSLQRQDVSQTNVDVLIFVFISWSSGTSWGSVFWLHSRLFDPWLAINASLWPDYIGGNGARTVQ